MENQDTQQEVVVTQIPLTGDLVSDPRKFLDGQFYYLKVENGSTRKKRMRILPAGKRGWWQLHSPGGSCRSCIGRSDRADGG